MIVFIVGLSTESPIAMIVGGTSGMICAYWLDLLIIKEQERELERRQR